MTLPQPVERLWNELEHSRADLLREAEGLSQRQAEWKPSEREWSVGEIIDHLTLAEINTGKLTTKLLKELPGGAGAFPSDLIEFAREHRALSRASFHGARVKDVADFELDGDCLQGHAVRARPDEFYSPGRRRR